LPQAGYADSGNSVGRLATALAAEGHFGDTAAAIPYVISHRGVSMRRLLVASVIAVTASGCVRGPSWTVQPGQPIATYCENPTLVSRGDPALVWETVVDVVDDYFEIEHEEPVRTIGNVLTEGRLDTVAQVSPTILEPWRDDTVGSGQRIENTLQSMRRRALVRVMPAEEGFWVDVAVFKELEDVARPEHATAGAATFRYDDSLRRVVNPVGDQLTAEGWIPQGRDAALEQKIVGHLQARLNPTGRVGFPMTR